MPSRCIPVLTYHSLDESHSVISTSVATFKKQMEYLWKECYQTLPLSEVASFIHQRKAFPEKGIVITFDDGYKNVYTDAFPILEQYGFNATIFLITEYCGKLNNWPGQSLSIKRSPLLSWPEIREMSNYGFEFGAHTLTHPDLDLIPIQQAEQEIIQSKVMIQDHLSTEVKVFAYPYGRYNSKIKDIVQQHFLAACTTELGKVKTGCDPYRLKRIDMYYLTSPKRFIALQNIALDWYLQMRQLFRDITQIFE